MKLALFSCALLLATSAFAQQQARPPSSRTSPAFSEVPQMLLDQTPPPPQGLLSPLEVEKQIQVTRLPSADRRRSCDRDSPGRFDTDRKARESLENTRRISRRPKPWMQRKKAEKICRLNAAMFFVCPV